MKKAIVLPVSLFIYVISCAQFQPVYVFQKDDTVLKHTWYKQVMDKKKSTIDALGKEHKDDYKAIYEAQYDEVGAILKTTRAVTSKEEHAYLQGMIRKIVDANPELKDLDLRVVFSRDWWPNAYSMGEGTLMVNAGLMVFLENEAELVFVLCHEIAHYKLDHSGKKIKQMVEMMNSEDLKKEVKKLSKEQYRIGQRLAEIEKSLVFNTRRHSRENESEADRYAFRYMKNTGYDCNAIVSVLNLLDNIDDSLLYRPLDLPQVFESGVYPFRMKWIEKQTSIFSQMTSEETPLTRKERDSMKTHPDCQKRIEKLNDSITMTAAKNKFLVDENMFRRLKKDFFVEMTEENYREKNLSRNLYYNLLMLQQGENVPLAVFSIARCLNDAYEGRKKHTFGKMIDAESKYFPPDYNLLLRMLNRIRLDEIAALNYHFCAKYLTQMKDYEGFTEEMMKVEKVFKP